jgi:hypothetical protein
MGVEVPMRYAWLEFHRGLWLLLTDDEKVPAKAARGWMDKETALAELTGEGWTISGPYPKRQRTYADSKQGFYGFPLTRTIH